jgi:hypothetical protein
MHGTDRRVLTAVGDLSIIPHHFFLIFPTQPEQHVDILPRVPLAHPLPTESRTACRHALSLTQLACHFTASQPEKHVSMLSSLTRLPTDSQSSMSTYSLTILPDGQYEIQSRFLRSLHDITT